MDYAYTLVIIVAVGLGVWYMSKRRGFQGSKKTAFVFDEFTRDFTADAAAGRLDPVIGRDEEIDRVIQVITRRRKNNPLLIGEAGVGKTAIVEGLAQRIADRKVPEQLREVRLMALNLADMLAGTAFRGELENRIKQFTSQLETLSGNIILFIDEIHMIHQVKGVQGGLNLSDMLKPALARGEIAILGATTWHEYRDSLRGDPAIERRFQPILVGEPSRDAAIEILRHLKPEYERYHKVEITDEAIVAAVDSSMAFIKNRFLPDKAIDVIDEASARVALDGTMTHKLPLGVIEQAASETTLASLENEREALEGEIQHLDEIHKTHPEDAEISTAKRVLEAHIDDIRADEKMIRSGPISTVTAENVEQVIRAWKRYFASHPEKDK